MPMYEYECGKGHRFERYCPTYNGHNTECPECGTLGRLQMSLFRYRLASPLPVYLSDGTKIHEFRDAPAIRPLSTPEELVRAGVLSNAADRFEPQKIPTGGNR